MTGGQPRLPLDTVLIRRSEAHPTWHIATLWVGRHPLCDSTTPTTYWPKAQLRDLDTPKICARCLAAHRGRAE